MGNENLNSYYCDFCVNRNNSARMADESSSLFDCFDEPPSSQTLHLPDVKQENAYVV